MNEFHCRCPRLPADTQSNDYSSEASHFLKSYKATTLRQFQSLLIFSTLVLIFLNRKSDGDYPSHYRLLCSLSIGIEFA
jgi:hypothetical protein